MTFSLDVTSGRNSSCTMSRYCTKVRCNKRRVRRGKHCNPPPTTTTNKRTKNINSSTNDKKKLKETGRVPEPTEAEFLITTVYRQQLFGRLSSYPAVGVVYSCLSSTATPMQTDWGNYHSPFLAPRGNASILL